MEEKKEVIVEGEISLVLPKTVESFQYLHNQIMFCGAKAREFSLMLCKNLKIMQDLKLYETAGIESFKDYVQDQLGLKERQAYNYISIAEKYSSKFLDEYKNVGITKLLLLSEFYMNEEEIKTEITPELLENSTVVELRKQLETSKKELKCIIELGDEEKKKMQDSLSKTKKELSALKKEIEELKKSKILVTDDKISMDYEGKIKELESQCNILEAEKIKSERNSIDALNQLKMEKEELKKKLSLNSDSKFIMFKGYFSAFSSSLKAIVDFIESVSEDDFKKKCYLALRKQFFEVALDEEE